MYLRCKLVLILSLLAVSLLLTSCVSTTGSELTSAEYDFKHHYYARSFKKLWYPAHNGSPRAQYALGYLYFYGLGTVLDQDLARIWFKRSAHSHYPPAVEAYRQITNTEYPQTVPMHSATVHPTYRYRQFHAAKHNKKVAK